MAKLISLWTMSCLLLSCGNFERSNPFDPTVEGSITDLNAVLVGTWSRADVEKNQVYTFKEDGRVEIRDYSAPGGGDINRNGSYPETLVLSFSGTYILVGDRLRISFTSVMTNDPSGLVPSLRDKVVPIAILGNVLIMKEVDGNREYMRGI